MDMHTCTHTYLHTYIHACIHTHMHATYIHKKKIVYMYVCVYAHAHTCIYSSRTGSCHRRRPVCFFFWPQETSCMFFFLATGDVMYFFFCHRSRHVCNISIHLSLSIYTHTHTRTLSHTGLAVTRGDDEAEGSERKPPGGVRGCIQGRLLNLVLPRPQPSNLKPQPNPDLNTNPTL